LHAPAETVHLTVIASQASGDRDRRGLLVLAVTLSACAALLWMNDPLIRA
jgi:hypothetical protein